MPTDWIAGWVVKCFHCISFCGVQGSEQQWTGTLQSSQLWTSCSFVDCTMFLTNVASIVGVCLGDGVCGFLWNASAYLPDCMELVIPRFWMSCSNVNLWIVSYTLFLLSLCHGISNCDHSEAIASQLWKWYSAYVASILTWLSYEKVVNPKSTILVINQLNAQIHVL